MDVDARRRVQGRVYHDIIEGAQQVYSHPVSITLWGLTDKYTWLQGVNEFSTGGPVVFRDSRDNPLFVADGDIYDYHLQRKQNSSYSGVLKAINEADN